MLLTAVCCYAGRRNAASTFVRLSAAVPADRTQMNRRIHFVLWFFNRLQFGLTIIKSRHSSKPLTVSSYFMTTKATLAFYVDDIKNWRRSIYTDGEIATNATNDVSYLKWDEVEKFFSHLLNTKQISQLDEEDRINLIYLFARGWDNAAFLNELTEDRPISSRGDLTDEDFIKLADTATTISGTEYDDAKSSIAMCFRKFEYLTAEMENILLKLYADSNEYTKKMALFALAKLGYKDTISLVEKSWKIDDEWHKIGCLHVLDENLSDNVLLCKYLEEPVSDSRQHLADYVQQLKTKNNC
jgi:hypothetical protein